MKRRLLIIAVALLAVAISAPAFAEVEIIYGGSYRVRGFAQDNVFDGTETAFTKDANTNTKNKKGQRTTETVKPRPADKRK
ncbi:MAG: hypothetical protein WAW37_14920 [Syntrophobacteraceae bacterium]